LTHLQNAWNDIWYSDKHGKACYIKWCMCALPAIPKWFSLMISPKNVVRSDVTYFPGQIHALKSYVPLNFLTNPCIKELCALEFCDKSMHYWVMCPWTLWQIYALLSYVPLNFVTNQAVLSYVPLNFVTNPCIKEWRALEFCDKSMHYRVMFP